MKQTLLILDADYVEENGKAVIRLWCKDEKGGNVVVLDENFKPYFYVLPENGKEQDVKRKIVEFAPKDVVVKDVEIIERILSGKKKNFLKVFSDLPQNVPKLRDVVKQWKGGIVVEEYEYAINFYRRYLMDNGLSGFGWIEVDGEKINRDYQADSVIKLKRMKPIAREKTPNLNMLAFDIESVEENGKIKIIMISLANEKFKKVLTYQKSSFPKYVEVVDDERQMLERFVQIVNEQDPDIILGYNSDEFDFDVIDRRASELKVDLNLSRDGSVLKFTRRVRTSSARMVGRVHIDLFDFIRTILSAQMQTEVLSLDAVSAELLGDKKIEVEFEEILEMWRKKKNLSKLAEYSLKDSELTLRLAHLIVPQISELCKVVGQLPFDVSRMSYGQLVEWYLSRKAVEKENIIPNQPKWEEIEERREYTYIGGFVKEPIGGLHENIAVLDFRSLYPSIIATFNISPETLNCSCCKRDGHKVPESKNWFCKKHKGFVSTVINELIEKRKEIKNRMEKTKKYSEEYKKFDNEQYALKIISNACYGMFAFAGAKWYCKECAEAAAAFGRHYIKKVIDDSEKEKFVVIYGDTDSLFVKSTKNIENDVEKFLGKVNKSLPGILEMDLQGIYKRGIFIPRGVGPGTAKKRYALIDKKGVLTIRGLEKVRRDWSDIARDTQEKVLKLVLDKKDVDGAVKYVKDIIKRIRAHKVELRELTIREQLTKPLSEYKAIGPHVAVAQKIMERGRPIVAGMVLMFVITKGTGSISERAEPIEDANVQKIDEEYYIGNQVVPAALRVLQVLGVSEEQLLGKEVKGLKSFVNKK